MPSKAAHPAKPESTTPARSSRNALHDAHCKPLKGAAHRTDPADIERLLKQLQGWKLVDDGAAIEKTYAFADYYHTLAFVNALAWIAHREDHHPDLGVHYNRCVVRYSTHDVGGVSMNDFICAAKAELLA